MRCRAVATLWLAVLSSPIQAADEDESAPYPDTGIILGNGWLANEGRKTAQSCVIADTGVIEGERRNLNYSELTDTASLMRALSISAKAKARSIFGGSLGASGRYGRTITHKSDSLQIFVNFTISKGTSYLQPKADALGDGAAAIALQPSMAVLARTNPVEFRRRCGDGYVSTIKRRIALDGIYTFTTRSDEERRDIRGKMSGSFGTFEASGSSRETSERLEREGRLKIQFLQDGGEGLAVPLTDAAFRTLVSSLGSTSGTAVPNQIVVSDYRSLPNYPQTGAAGPSEIGALADQYYRLMYLDDVITDLVEEGTLGPSYTMSVSSARRLQDDIRRETSAVKVAIERCVDSADPCRFPQGIDRHDYKFRAQMPISLFDVPGWYAHLSMIDQEYQRAATEAQRTHNPALPALTQQRVAALRAEARVAEKAARFKYWIEQTNDARCLARETDICLLNAQLEDYRRILQQTPENFGG